MAEGPGTKFGRKTRGQTERNCIGETGEKLIREGAVCDVDFGLPEKSFWSAAVLTTMWYGANVINHSV